MQHLDLVVADAELIGDDLRDGRLVTLAVRRRPDQDLHGSGRKEANRRSVPAAGAVADRAEDAGRSETAHLEIGREADPELLRVATLAAPGLFLAHRVVVEQLERRVEVRVVVARVDGEPRRDRLRELAQEVQPANLDRILAELARQRVHRALDRVRRFGTARSAVRVRRSRRREDAGALEVVRDDVVRARVQPCTQQRDSRCDELEIGSHPGGQLRADGADLPFRCCRELDLLDLVAAVDRRLIPLSPRLDPLDRTAELAREHERERFLRVDVELRPEAAADLGRDHAKLRLGNARHHRERDPRDVRDLRRRPHRQLAGRGERLHDQAAGLHRVRDQPLLPVTLLDRNFRIRELFLDLAGGEVPRVAAVRAEVVVDDRCAVLERALRIDDRGQGVVLDLHELGRVACFAPRLRDYYGHAVARIPSLVDGERPVIRLLRILGREPRARQRRLPLVGEIVA